MKTALRIAALFAVYSGIGWSGDYAADLLAHDRLHSHDRVHVDVEPHVAVQPRVHVDVEPAVHVDVRVRRSGECSYTRTYSAAVPTRGAAGLAIDAGAGELRVESHGDAQEIRVAAAMCASDEEILDELRVVTSEGADGIALATRFPDGNWTRRGNSARIDLTISVPEGFAVSIDDSSGDIEVTGTGDLRIEDSSGSIDAWGIRGSVSIDDSSGDIDVREISGDVQIEDGSGSLDVRDVQGSVLLRDGSGGIEVASVVESVIVESDGSGSIRVNGVGGDFFVESDGSGSITFADVAGTVEHPDKRRRRRRRPGR